jgi:hypothetical protein
VLEQHTLGDTTSPGDALTKDTILAQRASNNAAESSPMSLKLSTCF